MYVFTEEINKLIQAFGSLPGIGHKSAQRLAFHVINMPKNKVEEFADIIVSTKENIKYCSVCCNLTDTNPCRICDSDNRDKSTVMVVEDVRDMAAYEKTRQYKGTYHILHGAISPLSGLSPNDIKIPELLERIKNEEIYEIILATNPNVEGEATAMYLNKIIKPLGIKVTRIANGVPVGGDLEYIDEITLLRALEGRREM